MKQQFFFYKSYVTDVEGCFTEAQYREYLEAIISYGVTGTFQIEDPCVLSAFTQRRASIDASQSRYERAVKNGKKGGRKPQLTGYGIARVLVADIVSEPYPASLAEFFGCSEKTILRKFSKEELADMVELAELKRDARHYERYFDRYSRCGFTDEDKFLFLCDILGPSRSTYLAKYFVSKPREFSE